MNEKPIASDIYERLEMNQEGLGGSVQDDLDYLDVDDWDEYFGDLDPVEFL